MIEAEQALLGIALFDNRAIDASLRPEQFQDPLHGSMWAFMLEARQKSRLVEPTMLAKRFEADERFHEFGGMSFLADLVDAAPPLPQAPHFRALVADGAARRELVRIGQEIVATAQEGETAFERIADADRHISALLHGCAPDEETLVDARTSAMATVDELEREAKEGRAKGTMTGLRCFDYRLKGLRPGWLVVVAGRPSMGKTALARVAALGAARRTKAQVVFFALEMARRELDERTLSQLSFEGGDGIAYTDMNGDKLPVEDRARLRSLVNQIPPNFIIDDSPVLSVDYVRRRVLSLKRRGPLAAVFIDYLQIMERPDAKGRNEASVIGEMTKGLKQLAREAEICVVLLSQINRGVESRDDKRPQLSDLRESGAIEQDANAVLFPYREVYYLERQAPKSDSREATLAHDMRCEEFRRRMDVIAAKVRQGAVGTDEQVYHAEFDFIGDKQ